MAQFLSHPKFQAFDSNGDPLNGGKLYTYDVGTTDNKASYPTIADALAATNANANPVILDSRGEADVVLIGNTKLKLDTSADVNVWTLDNVNSDADMIDANGNQLFEFTTTASAVNHLGAVNAATGNSPILRAEGEADTGITFDNRDGEEILILNSIASSVNEFSISSAATGNNPILEATGETNVGIEFQAKGTGQYDFKSTTSQACKITLQEDSDNGTNTVGFQAPGSISSSVNFVLPDADGTNGQAMVSNGSGSLSFKTVPSQATQAALEAETNEDTYAPPDLIKHNPGVAKAWIYLTNSGTPTINVSRNVSSLTDTSTGLFSVNFTTAFSGNHTATGTAIRGGTGAASVNVVQFVTISTTADAMSTYAVATGGGANAEVDCDACLEFFGDQ